MSLKYRAEIDGLRAFAVIAVILYHAGFAAFGGGFLGVDIFFVISGYLITGIVHGEIEQGTFSLVSFYERRLRRIMPALYLVILVCMPFAWLWLFQSDLHDFAKSMVAVMYFGSNIFFERSISYFSPNIENFPLIHTWSLGVEEQFYAIFPLLLVFLKRLNRKLIVPALLILSVSSLGLAEYMSRANPQYDFYLLPTRAWELGIGALIALIPRGSILLTGWAAETAAATGLSLIVVAVTFIDASFPLPGLWSVVPVGGAALLILCACEGTFVGKILSFKPFVFIGLISYSAYLWHQPLFAFARVRFDIIPASPVMILLSLAAFGFALISWKYIETPFRTKTVFSRRFIFISSLVIGLSFIAIGRIIIINKGFPERWSNEIGAVTELAAKPALLESKCFGGMQEFMHPDESCVLNAPLEAHFAIWGDSHSIVLAQEFANQLKDNAEALRIFSFSGCPPVNDIHFSEPTRQLCPSYNHLVLDYIKSHSEITTIILFARWSMYLDGEAYDNGEGGTTGSHQLFALPVGKDAHFLDHPDRIKAVGALFRAQIETLISLGKKVVLVYPVPEIGWSVPERMAKSIFQHPGSERQPVSINYNRYKQRSADFNAQMTILPDNANVLRIHPDEVFCDSGKYGRCRAELEGKPLYFDDNHLGALGAALLSKQIKDAMKLKGWL